MTQKRTTNQTSAKTKKAKRSKKKYFAIATVDFCNFPLGFLFLTQGIQYYGNVKLPITIKYEFGCVVNILRNTNALKTSNHFCVPSQPGHFNCYVNVVFEFAQGENRVEMVDPISIFAQHVLGPDTTPGIGKEFAPYFNSQNPLDSKYEK